MEEKAPTLKEWRQLYQLAGEIKELHPWENMFEYDIFGVKDPQSGELAFVSIMGSLGEHLAIAAYLGIRGLTQFWSMQESGPNISMDAFTQVYQLQLSFEDRNILLPQDRKIIKQLGLAFRGKNSWPLFRSYLPGYFPWLFNLDEARFFVHILEQALNVIPRYMEDENLLNPGGNDDYLIRIPSKTKKGLVWKDKVMNIPLLSQVEIPMAMNMATLRELSELPGSNNKLEIDVFTTFLYIQEKNERPLVPYILLILDSETGMIVGTEMIDPLPTPEEMWGRVPAIIVEKLVSTGLRPESITVRKPILYSIFQSVCEELAVSLQLTQQMPIMDEAIKHFEDFMSQR